MCRRHSLMPAQITQSASPQAGQGANGRLIAAARP
jgi:hypothetical protein